MKGDGQRWGKFQVHNAQSVSELKYRLFGNSISEQLPKFCRLVHQCRYESSWHRGNDRESRKVEVDLGNDCRVAVRVIPARASTNWVSVDVDDSIGWEITGYPRNLAS